MAETSRFPSSSGRRRLFGPVGKKGYRILEFITCKLTGQHTDPQQPGTEELLSQGSRFCLLIFQPARKRRLS